VDGKCSDCSTELGLASFPVFQTNTKLVNMRHVTKPVKIRRNAYIATNFLHEIR
jgi:hypothetical protein